MEDLIIGIGNLQGKGIYAGRDFTKDDIVIRYSLRSLTENEYNDLSQTEKEFVHTHWGQKYLYAIPERYVNHSDHPNTKQDRIEHCDIAVRDIKKGEMITTDSSRDDV